MRPALLAALVLAGCASQIDCGPADRDPVMVHATFADDAPVEDLVVTCVVGGETIDARIIEPGLYGCPGAVPSRYGVTVARGAITRTWSLSAPRYDRPCVDYPPQTIELVLPR